MSNLIQGDFGNLIHGVSQQPDERKLKGQVRGQKNCRSNVKRGPEKRAGFELVGELTNNDYGLLEHSKWLLQESGDGSAYLVGLGRFSPAVWDIEANRLPFTFGSGAEAYYTHALTDPQGDLTHQSVLDTVFLSNRNFIPTGFDFADSEADLQDIIFMDFGTFQPGTKIQITISAGIGYTYTVFDGYVTVNPSSGVPDAVQKLKTEEYNGSFHTAKWAVDENNKVTAFNNWVRIFNGGTTRIVKGGDVIKMVSVKEIKAIEKLPPYAHNGDIAQVREGTGEENNKGWFKAVALNGRNNEMTEVKWEETISPGSRGEMNANTMPHRIVRDAQDNFSMIANDWDLRKTGGPNSNPYPSFITNGVPITAIGLFQNRLFLTSGEGINLSTTDEFYNLWNESAFFLTDADPFEALADTDEINVLRYAQSFDGDLVFFSDNAQFIMSGEHNHTYADSFVQPASQYKSDLTADPVSAGDVLFFGINYGNYGGLREFYVADFNATRKARPITQHVDELIPGNIRVLTASKTIDVLACLASEGPQNVAYFYEYLRDDLEAVQQAWSEWELPDECDFEWIGFSGATLYAVVRVRLHNGTYTYQLWKMKYDDPSSNHGINFPIRLDGRFETTAVYDSLTDLSTITPPYFKEDIVFVEGPESDDPGFEPHAFFDTGTGEYTVDGDISAMTLIGGMRFMSEIEFAMPTVKDHEGNTMAIDRLNMGRMYLHFTTVGEVGITISDGHGRSKELNYNNRRTNHLNNLPSYIPVDSSTWAFSVRKNMDGLSIKLYSDSVTPFTIRAVEWKGSRTQKGRRV